MIERVRQAIIKSDNCPGPNMPAHIGVCQPDESCACYRSARAAIEAMRDPTAEMFMAGTRVDGVTEIYQNMIDEALK